MSVDVSAGVVIVDVSVDVSSWWGHCQRVCWCGLYMSARLLVWTLSACLLMWTVHVGASAGVDIVGKSAGVDIANVFLFSHPGHPR